MYETPINRQVTAFFATQIVVLNVDGSSPSGHPPKKIPVSQVLAGIFNSNTF